MNQLNYSKNFNGKLFCDIFNDVRLSSGDKFILGNCFEVCINNTPIGIVTIVAVRTFEYKNIGDVLSQMVCGKPAAYLATLLKNFYPAKNIQSGTLFDHIVLHYTNRYLDTQAGYLQDWWRSKIAEQPDYTPIVQPSI